MIKKWLASLLAGVLVFGSAAVLPEVAVSIGSDIVASAEQYGDYEYEVLSDGTAEIGTYDGRDEVIALPSSINGKSVTSIGEYTFDFCDFIKEVTIPEGIKSIGTGAFFYCTSLKSVTIPKSVTSIGEGAFGYWDKDDKWCVLDGILLKCYSNTEAEKYAKENNIKYELLDATVHTHSYISKVVKPTYDAEGYTLHTCSVCGVSYKDSFTAKLTRKSISKASVSGLKNKYYTGKAIKQTPVVKLGNKTLKSGTDYTVTYKNNKAVGTATVTVTGKGAYTGTVKATFKICPKKTTLKTVKSPKTKQLKATYTKVAGVTGYQVTYSTSSKFTKKTTKSVNASGTSKTISKLTKGKTYYVKVRTYKTVGKTKYYSGYSAVKKVKVK